MGTGRFCDLLPPGGLVHRISPLGSCSTFQRGSCLTRDPEAARELLSCYFEVARTVIGRYGGVVEKFIGDAVMAVWGTPAATEGDAERAVRAGLDLVAAVADLGAEAEVAGLRARAGVVTGEVAVTLGASGEGMVAGDAVNTAARVQAAAEPGQVLADGATQRLAEAGVGFADAGEHALKGKAEPARAACELGDTAATAELLALLDACQPGHLAPMQRAERDLVHARLAASGGDPAAAEPFAAAISSLRELSTPYHLAHGLLDHASYLTRLGDTQGAAAAIGEARDIAGGLRCQPLLDRATDIMPATISESERDRAAT
jgi:class 3 adenylate cyclase